MNSSRPMMRSKSNLFFTLNSLRLNSSSQPFGRVLL
jgi:hypothetical protein